MSNPPPTDPPMSNAVAPVQSSRTTDQEVVRKNYKQIKQNKISKRKQKNNTAVSTERDAMRQGNKATRIQGNKDTSMLRVCEKIKGLLCKS